MGPDDSAWQSSEEEANLWLEFTQAEYQAVLDFILEFQQGTPIQQKVFLGGCNVSFCVKYQDKPSIVLRFPIPGMSKFPDEKIPYEVATMQWLKENTSVPVPRILKWGTSDKIPSRLGPFIMMEYINHDRSLQEVLNTPGLTDDDLPVLNPHIDTSTLRHLYRQVADVLLQLSKIPLPNIGSFVPRDNGLSWDLNGRPLSMHWNELVRLGNLPQPQLPTTAFTTSSSYFSALADLHIKHLTCQPNDSVVSVDDCHQKFLARLLFRKHAEKHVLSTHSNSFRLWCDDLRPANILLDADLRIVGIIDWEFTYSAPAEFIYAPPWWLLLERPERWGQGLGNWEKEFEKRLACFIEMLEDCENNCIQQGGMNEEERLSARMKESWNSGNFWFVYGAMRNFAFDTVYRQKLDGILFKPKQSWDIDWRSRVKHLNEEERSELVGLVNNKLVACGLSNK